MDIDWEGGHCADTGELSKEGREAAASPLLWAACRGPDPARGGGSAGLAGGGAGLAGGRGAEQVDEGGWSVLAARAGLALSSLRRGGCAAPADPQVADAVRALAAFVGEGLGGCGSERPLGLLSDRDPELQDRCN